VPRVMLENGERKCLEFTPRGAAWWHPVAMAWLVVKVHERHISVGAELLYFFDSVKLAGAENTGVAVADVNLPLLGLGHALLNHRAR
jgi:hypothetical protein